MRFSDKVQKLTEDQRKPRKYLCQRKYGGCGQEWTDVRAPHSLYTVTCPNCELYGDEEVWDPHLNKKVKKVVIVLDQLPNMITDISGQDGRTNQDVDMSPTLGQGKRFSSRSQIEDELKRTREESYESTEGEHSRMVPFKGDPTDPESPIVWEKVTSVHQGFDPGELHHVEQLNDEPNRPKSSFSKSDKTVEEVDKELEAKVGPEDMGMENVPWEEVQRVSDEMYERALKK